MREGDEKEREGERGGERDQHEYDDQILYSLH